MSVHSKHISSPKGKEKEDVQSVLGERTLLLAEDADVVSYYSQSIDIGTREEDEDWARNWSADEDEDDYYGYLPLHHVAETIQDLLIYDPAFDSQYQYQNVPATPAPRSRKGPPTRRQSILSVASNNWQARDQSMTFSIAASVLMARTADCARDTQSAQSVWDVGRKASVSGVLAMLDDPKQGLDKDVIEQLALAVLKYGMSQKPTTQTDAVFLQQILARPWFKNHSALEWAIKYDCQCILSDPYVAMAVESIWLKGPEWRTDKEHPCSIWSSVPYSTGWRRTLSDSLARWASPRYQTVVAFLSGLIYFGFHLGVLVNEDYRNYWPYDYEYIYYGLVISDLLLEVFKILKKPLLLTQGSTYFTLLCVGLLAGSFGFRYAGLWAVDLEDQIGYLEDSFNILICATPLLFGRLLVWAKDLWWPLIKLKIVVGECIAGTSGVLGLAVSVVAIFWVGLSVLQKDDMSPGQVFIYLALGAVHSPAIGDTVASKPTLVGIILFVYLFLMSVCITSMVTSAFLSTMIDINTRLESLEKSSLASRSIKPAVLGAYLPNAVLEIILGLVDGLVFLAGRQSIARERIERIRQIGWYLIFSPIVIPVAILDLWVS
ncbi:hypothetical protein CLU79DRAFT_762717 [Phycomyces nitens]|nr:hypothetical protein CLU79DRAFT_762717 [Phycomyces nitens]